MARSVDHGLSTGLAPERTALILVGELSPLLPVRLAPSRGEAASCKSNQRALVSRCELRGSISGPLAERVIIRPLELIGVTARMESVAADFLAARRVTGYYAGRRAVLRGPEPAVRARVL